MKNVYIHCICVNNYIFKLREKRKMKRRTIVRMRKYIAQMYIPFRKQKGRYQRLVFNEI